MLLRIRHFAIALFGYHLYNRITPNTSRRNSWTSWMGGMGRTWGGLR